MLLNQLTIAERERLLKMAQAQISRTPEPEHARDKCVHRLFEEQAKRRPDAIALEYEHENLTYRELNRRANQLGHHLREVGVKPEVRVAVFVERGVQTAVALWGVLKAGGIYVPLDPAYPRQRLQCMVEDCEPAVVVTQTHWGEKLSVMNEGVIAVEMDSETVGWRTSPETSLEAWHIEVNGKNGAYMIYTSGTTGKPKGVVIDHQGLMNTLIHTQELLEISEEDVMPSLASMAFDISLLEMMVGWVGGGRTRVVSREALLDMDQLMESLQGATVLNAVPALMGQIMEAWGKNERAAERKRRSGLRKLLTGGDRVSATVLKQLRDAVPEADIRVLYGPTEAAIICTHTKDLSRWEESGAGTIGTAIRNMRVYVLDEEMEAVPEGVVGELYIGGVGVGRGYEKQAELTAEKFVPDVHGGEEGERMYKTGDVGRWRRDRTIEFLGRNDSQVKIRGYRIELGEIEAALMAHPAISHAVTIACGEGEQKQLISYVTCRQGETHDELVSFAADTSPILESSSLSQALKQHLQQLVPAHMIPARFIALRQFPLTVNGKVNLAVLPSFATQASTASTGQPHSSMELIVSAIWEDVLKISNPGIHQNFFDLGGHSLAILRMQAMLQKTLGRKVPAVKLFEYPTIASSAQYLAQGMSIEQVQQLSKSSQVSKTGVPRIAIIGLSGRFPNAPSIEAFWENLKRGIGSVESLSEEALAAVPAATLNKPGFVKVMGRLSNVDKFDASCFGMSAAEAVATDPQQRLLLECAWEALERAGYDTSSYAGRIGVFAGASESRYRDLLNTDRTLSESIGDMQLTIGVTNDHIAPRLSYLLNLHGPSVSIQTACSTSLVAVHYACQSLLNSECDLALVGASSINPVPNGYFYKEGGISSPDGCCRAYDAAACGTVPGNGVGVIVLKRLADASADGDHIHAIICGSAVNNDGASKVGYTAPSVEGQRSVIRQALANAGLSANQISYVEGHGTGTPLGDSIEVEALRQAFGNDLPPASCALGSVKTNIGHCDAAAGIAGLIKAVLCLENRTIVSSLNFERPNPQLDLDHSPFYVSTQTVPWNRTPRFAGVSSFGIGGTNAHVVLQEAPPTVLSGSSRTWQLLTLSARTESALEAREKDLLNFLENDFAAPIADIAFTLNSGRKSFPLRQAFVCENREAAAGALTRAKQKVVRVNPSVRSSVVFLFPGQGSAYKDLGRDLYREEVCFREEVDRCCKILTPLLQTDLTELLFQTGEEAREKLLKPAFWQPALFVTEYAMARLWMSWGIKPAAMIGHSLGEYVAATLAGVFELDDALALVANRGRSTETLEPGAMLALSVDESSIQSLLKGTLSLAAVNAPELCIVSGSREEVSILEHELSHSNPIRLATNYAFHSSMVDPLMEPLVGVISKFKLNPPKIPYLSNLTGTWIRDEEATDPVLWARHLRNTVRFHDCLRNVLQEPGRVLLEVGPGKILTELAHRSYPNIVATPSLNDREADGQAIATAVGRLWSAGVPIDWSGYYRGEHRSRVLLPTYPFERQSYWVKAPSDLPVASAEDRKEVKDWLYAKTWKKSQVVRSVSAVEDPIGTGAWLIFGDEVGIAASLVKKLREMGKTVTEVHRGKSFSQESTEIFCSDPGNLQHYNALFTALHNAGRFPERIVYAFGFGSTSEEPLTDFENLIHMGQSLSQERNGVAIRLAVLATNLCRIRGDERLSDPAKAALLGIVQVLPRENPGISCQLLDFDVAEKDVSRCIAEVTEEFADETADSVVAYRFGQRWVPIYEKISVPPNLPSAVFRKNAVYLITNGLQEIGLALAERLTLAKQAVAVMVDRAFFPRVEEWEGWISTHSEKDVTSQRIARLRKLAGRVHVFNADPGELETMQSLKNQVEQTLGPMEGVFHLEKIMKPGLIEGKTQASTLKREIAEILTVEKVFHQVGWRALFSTNLAESGGVGQVDAAAWNAVVSHLAERACSCGERTMSIELGVRAWYEPNEDFPRNTFLEHQLRDRKQRYGASSDEYIDTIERVLSLKLSGVILSTIDLPPLIERQRLITTDYLQAQAGSPNNTRWAHDGAESHPRPDLVVPYVAPRNEIESLLSEIWKAALGFESIGVEDNFFELGGHSLLAVQLLKSMNDRFSTHITLKDLFDSPTIAELSEIISAGPIDAEQADFMDKLLGEIEGLSDELIRAALKSESLNL